MKSILKLLCLLWAVGTVFVLLAGNPAPKNQPVKQDYTPQIKAMDVALSQVITSAKDPLSIVISYAGVPKDLSAVCLEYYGRNGFGARVKNAALLYTDGETTRFFMDATLPSEAVRLWNKTCGSKDKDVTDFSDTANRHVQNFLTLRGLT